jgi:hypothetical protein
LGQEYFAEVKQLQGELAAFREGRVDHGAPEFHAQASKQQSGRLFKIWPMHGYFVQKFSSVSS